MVVGNGSTHEEAARAVREQVENILTDIKAKVQRLDNRYLLFLFSLINECKALNLNLLLKLWDIKPIDFKIEKQSHF